MLMKFHILSNMQYIFYYKMHLFPWVLIAQLTYVLKNLKTMQEKSKHYTFIEPGFLSYILKYIY